MKILKHLIIFLFSILPTFLLSSKNVVSQLDDTKTIISKINSLDNRLSRLETISKIGVYSFNEVFNVVCGEDINNIRLYNSQEEKSIELECQKIEDLENKLEAEGAFLTNKEREELTNEISIKRAFISREKDKINQVIRKRSQAIQSKLRSSLKESTKQFVLNNEEFLCCFPISVTSDIEADSITFPYFIDSNNELGRQRNLIVEDVTDKLIEITFSKYLLS